MMKFFQNYGSCTVGIHIILEEVGAEYEDHPISLADRDQFKAEYRAMNPKGKVPALVREDGSVLTEFPVIALWLARTYPQAGLIPAGDEGELRVLELMEYMVASVHMRGFTFMVVPMKFSPDAELQQQLVAHGKAVVTEGLGNVAEVLGDKDWLFGTYSIADATLFYLTRWAHQLKLDLPPTLVAHHRRMLGRPAVQRAMKAEGLDSVETGGALA